jgi:hypothetical protein
MADRHEHDHDEVLRAVRISAGLDRIRAQSTTFFALVAAAPDRATLERWIVDRFVVELDVASAALDQPVRSLLPRPAAGSAR